VPTLDGLRDIPPLEEEFH